MNKDAKEGRYDNRNYEDHNSSHRTSNNPNMNRNSRLVEMDNADAVILKLKIQKDRMQGRVNHLEKEEAELDHKVAASVRANNRDQAKYQLAKKKRVTQSKKDYYGKLSFLDQQIYNVEGAQDNVEFLAMVKDSNEVLADLNSKINMEEIETAKMLNEEHRMNQHEQNNLMSSAAFDQDIEDEYKKLEAHYMQNNFDNYGTRNSEHVSVRNSSANQDFHRKGEVIVQNVYNDYTPGMRSQAQPVGYSSNVGGGILHSHVGGVRSFGGNSQAQPNYQSSNPHLVSPNSYVVNQKNPVAYSYAPQVQRQLVYS